MKVTGDVTTHINTPHWGGVIGLNWTDGNNQCGKKGALDELIEYL